MEIRLDCQMLEKLNAAEILMETTKEEIILTWIRAGLDSFLP